MKKYFIVAMISAVMSAIFLTQLASARPYAYFSDVTDTHYGVTAINWLAANGVVQGYSDGTFRPDNQVNRAEFLKMLYETIGMVGYDSTELRFIDVPSNEWYVTYVKEAFATGVVNGYPDGTFRPANYINYAEAVKIVANGFFDVDDLHLNGIYRLCIADLSYMSESGAWYWKYFSVADRYCVIPEGLLTGISGLDPADLVSRGVMAELLYRAKAVKDNYDGEEYPRYNDGISPNGILGDDEEEGDDDMMTDDDDDVIIDDEPFSLASSEFDNNGTIDVVNTCDGSDFSPQLSIAGVPDNTASLALILDDPDAPSGSWIHWLVWNILPDTTIINGGGGLYPPFPNEVIQGTNSFGNTYYGGPCPPPEDGAHRYVFDLYALDTTLNLDSSATKGDLVMAMDGHILDTAELIGLYDSN